MNRLVLQTFTPAISIKYCPLRGGEYEESGPYSTPARGGVWEQKQPDKPKYHEAKPSGIWAYRVVFAGQKQRDEPKYHEAKPSGI